MAALDGAEALALQVGQGDPRRGVRVCRQRRAHDHGETEERQEAVDYLSVGKELLTWVHELYQPIESLLPLL